MKHNKWMVVSFVALMLALSGCGESPVELAPIAGKWVHHSAQNQDWTYEFPNDTEVRFAIDGKGADWTIEEIRVRGSIIEIDIDQFLGRGARRNSTIKVEMLRENHIFVSSGLHPGMLFERY
jgi:hypothetical protein